MAQKITEYSRLLTLQLQWDWGGAQLSGASLKPLISLPVSIRQAFFYNTYFGNSPVIPLSQAFVCIWNTSTSDNKRNGDELTWFWLVLFGWCCHNYFFWGGGGGVTTCSPASGVRPLHSGPSQFCCISNYSTLCNQRSTIQLQITN